MLQMVEYERKKGKDCVGSYTLEGEVDEEGRGGKKHGLNGQMRAREFERKACPKFWIRRAFFPDKKCAVRQKLPESAIPFILDNELRKNATIGTNHYDRLHLSRRTNKFESSPFFPLVLLNHLHNLITSHYLLSSPILCFPFRAIVTSLLLSNNAIQILPYLPHTIRLGLASSVLHPPSPFKSDVLPLFPLTLICSSHLPQIVSLFLSRFFCSRGCKKRSECRSVPHRDRRGAKGREEEGGIAVSEPPPAIQNVIEKGWIKTGRTKKCTDSNAEGACACSFITSKKDCRDQNPILIRHSTIH